MQIGRRDSDIALRSCGWQELVPERIDIVTALRTSDQLPSRYRIEAVGYGAGKRPYEGCSGTLRCLLVHVDA